MQCQVLRCLDERFSKKLQAAILEAGHYTSYHNECKQRTWLLLVLTAVKLAYPYWEMLLKIEFDAVTYF